MWREREKKGESLIIVIEKLGEYTLDLGIYIHASGTHNTVRKEKEKEK